MSGKAKTTISIKQPVYEAALKIAAAEERDFSFIVERALLGELQAAGIDVASLGHKKEAEFQSKLSVALKAHPELRQQIERLLRKAERTQRAA